MHNISRVDLNNPSVLRQYLEAISDTGAAEQATERHSDATLRPLFHRCCVCQRAQLL